MKKLGEANWLKRQADGNSSTVEAAKKAKADWYCPYEYTYDYENLSTGTTIFLSEAMLISSAGLLVPKDRGVDLTQDLISKSMPLRILSRSRQTQGLHR